MSDKTPKKPLEGTLARFFAPEDDIKTASIDETQMVAHRRMGRVAGKRLMNSLERLKEKRNDKKE